MKKGVELEEMRAALERQRLMDGGYLEDGEVRGLPALPSRVRALT